MSRVTFAGEKVEFGAHPAMANPAPTGVAGAPRETTANILAAQNQNQNQNQQGVSSNLSCNTCKERFVSIEELRKHFDSELHIRNIRARVEGQPTMDRAEYRRASGAASNVSRAQQRLGGSVAGADSAFGGATPTFTCNLCKRTYKSAQTLQTHLRSTEHLVRKEQKIIERGSQAGSVVSSMSIGSAAMGLHRRHKAHKHSAAANDHDVDYPVYENVLSEDGETVIQRQVNKEKPKVSVEDREADVVPSRCFFCGFKSASIAKNLDHMLEHHEFTIPLQDRCKDLPALMEYLCKKINVCLCLVCAERTKKYETLEALRSHMRTADHERLVLSPEYQDFFSIALDDGKEANVEKLRDPHSGQLVIVTSSGAHICQREEGLHGGHRNVRNETTTQREERKMLTASKVEEHALILKERQELMAPQLKQDIKIARDNLLRNQRQQMKVSIRKGILHPKGYDGEGEVN